MNVLLVVGALDRLMCMHAMGDVINCRRQTVCMWKSSSRGKALRSSFGICWFRFQLDGGDRVAKLEKTQITEIVSRCGFV